MVANAREILHAAAAHEHDRVLLQVVAFSGDVGDDFESVGEANLGDFAQRRVRLLGGGGVHARAHATAERIGLERRRLFFFDDVASAAADELVDRWHETEENERDSPVDALPLASMAGGD